MKQNLLTLEVNYPSALRLAEMMRLAAETLHHAGQELDQEFCHTWAKLFEQHGTLQVLSMNVFDKSEVEAEINRFKVAPLNKFQLEAIREQARAETVIS